MKFPHYTLPGTPLAGSALTLILFFLVRVLVRGVTG